MACSGETASQASPARHKGPAQDHQDTQSPPPTTVLPFPLSLSTSGVKSLSPETVNCAYAGPVLASIIAHHRADLARLY